MPVATVPCWSYSKVMGRIILFALLLLPSLAQAVICKTIGEDGVASFTDVPASECPQGSRIPDYTRSAPQAERASAVDTGVRARQVEFAGYESIRIVSPEDGGTVRSNDGRVPIAVGLEPGLQQSHFITAYLDGKAFRGRYGSSQITLTGVDRGTHELYVKVSDSKGKTLVKSDTISFTALRFTPGITVNPISGDDTIDRFDNDYVLVRGLFRRGEIVRDEYGDPVKNENGEVVTDAWIVLQFPERSEEDWQIPRVQALAEPKTEDYWIETASGPLRVVETYNWEIPVPADLLAAKMTFDASARLLPATLYPDPEALSDTEFDAVPVNSKATSTHSVAPGVFSGYRKPYSKPDWTPSPPNYEPSTGGIPATPRQTNPAFKSKSNYIAN